VSHQEDREEDFSIVHGSCINTCTLYSMSHKMVIRLGAKIPFRYNAICEIKDDWRSTDMFLLADDDCANQQMIHICYGPPHFELIVRLILMSIVQ